jgi:hypothetical protein
MMNALKYSVLVTTLLGALFQWPVLAQGADFNPLVWLSAYVVCFILFYFLLDKKVSTQDEPEDPPANISSSQLEALYKQASIVERNALKANIVFEQQLQYVNRLLEKCKTLESGHDFNETRESLVKELGVLEQHVMRLLKEMNKNVKLGEKLQQSVANIDPEIGIIE